MMTKRQFAESLVNTYCEENNIARDSDLEAEVLKSSNLAVCLEFLGEIKNLELKEYTASRGGSFYQVIDENDKENPLKYISVRDMLEILPD